MKQLKEKNNEILLSEYQEQCILVEWLEMRNIKFTSIPNSTWTPSNNQMRKNHQSGLRKGLPDLLIVLPEEGLLFIEMKRRKKSKLSIEQKEWIDTLQAIPNVEATVCYGSDEAKAFIQQYIS